VVGFKAGAAGFAVGGAGGFGVDTDATDAVGVGATAGGADVAGAGSAPPGRAPAPWARGRTMTVCGAGGGLRRCATIVTINGAKIVAKAPPPIFAIRFQFVPFGSGVVIALPSCLLAYGPALLPFRPPLKNIRCQKYMTSLAPRMGSE
jgi:hypothetical protein